MIGALHSAASGMQAASLSMAAASHNIANLDAELPVVRTDVEQTPQADGQGVIARAGQRETVFAIDLLSEVVQLKMAEHQFKASAAGVKSANAMMGTLYNALDNQR